MYTLAALICLNGVAPADCTPRTSVDIIPGPPASLQQCLFGGMTAVAGNDAVRPKPGQYAKIICRPMREARK